MTTATDPHDDHPAAAPQPSGGKSMWAPALGSLVLVLTLALFGVSAGWIHFGPAAVQPVPQVAQQTPTEMCTTLGGVFSDGKCQFPQQTVPPPASLPPPAAVGDEGVAPLPADNQPMAEPSIRNVTSNDTSTSEDLSKSVVIRPDGIVASGYDVNDVQQLATIQQGMKWDATCGCQKPVVAPPPAAVVVPKPHPRPKPKPKVVSAPMICPHDVTSCGGASQGKSCSIQVRVQSAGNGYPADKLTAWADGGTISGKVTGAAAPHDGMVYIPVDCNFAYGDEGQVCFGQDYAMARNLNSVWFAVARKNLAKGQTVLNADSAVAELHFVDDGT